ncbi:hypothetical protein HSBAA_23870 [Vreelandella sulfidaeris]|uniref:Phosphohistidine phosphatase SixA n=1 Tax=Vreelandella sulfidaeris TaxID=115553 RepID=A0A455U975_9GAMM|nr:hypothetical protein HSBAA_23870 [Halomonas sulfidaeris]
MPNVLLMRHGEAARGYPDHARRLTPQGERESEKWRAGWPSVWLRVSCQCQRSIQAPTYERSKPRKR